jgi:tetratricopeptide (TPR) repeat protein
MSDAEIQAQDLVKRGQIDEAITIYQRLKPDSARVLNTIGMLYSEQKGDYDSAINYYEQALQIQEEVNIHRINIKKCIQKLFKTLLL